MKRMKRIMALMLAAIMMMARLLVRGERIPYEEATKQEPDTNIKPELSFTAKVLIVTIIVIFIGLMIAIIYSIRDRKRRKVR